MDSAQLPDYLMIPGELILDRDLQPLDGYVYGIVYWYARLKLQRCTATSETIANHLGVSEGSVRNSLTRLINRNYLQSHYNRPKHQRELIPMISFANSATANNPLPKKSEKSTSSNDDMPNELASSTSSFDDMARHQMMKSTSSNDEFFPGQLRTPIQKIYTKDINKKIYKRKSIAIKDITQDDVIEIAEKYNTTIGLVNFQLETLTNYCQSKGRLYKDHKAALRNFVLAELKRQAERRIGDPSKKGIDARDL